MSILSAFFRRKENSSASVAKERLTLVLAHERGRSGSGDPSFLPQLKREILAVVAKYVKVNEDQINVRLDDEDDTSILEINIELPQKN
jgi:cell division topological specificity factor